MPERRTYYRPVRIAGLLLVAQSASLAALFAYQAAHLRRGTTDGPRWLVQGLAEALGEAGVGVPAAALFLPTAALALVAGAWFLLWRTGWALASVSQALCLGSCLLLYSASAPGYIYPVMAYSVLTVMYLNSRDVRTILHAPRKSWTAKAGSKP